MHEKIQPIELVREGTIVVTQRRPHKNLFTDTIVRMVHLGIAAKAEGETFIYDLHPDNRNDSGGSLLRKPIADYMRGRELVGTLHTGATTARIEAVAKLCWNGKYEKYHFNCQQFIDYITHKQHRSDLYSYYTGNILLIAAAAGFLVIAGTVYMLSKNEEK